MTKKNVKNILKIAIPSAIVLTAAAVLCGAYYGSSNEIGVIEYPDVIGHTQYCTHSIDQEYTEPTVTPGKYYLNGDTDSAYIDVTENTWQILPGENCSLEEIYGELNHWSDEAPADPTTALEADATPTLTEERIIWKERELSFYSELHEYTVVTWHPFDIIWLCPGPGPDRDSVASEDDSLQPAPQSYWEDEIGFPGPTLVDEKTIKSFGGDYILVE